MAHFRMVKTEDEIRKEFFWHGFTFGTLLSCIVLVLVVAFA